MEWWEERFAQSLDETEELVTVVGLTFDPSRVVRELDPIAFRCYALDYADGMGWDTGRDEDEQGPEDNA